MDRSLVSAPFEQILHARYSRRDTLERLFTVSASAAVIAGGAGMVASCSDGDDKVADAPRLTFREIPHTYDATHHVPEGYSADILVRWGDQIVPGGSAPFRPQALSAEAQAKQFGYNNDFIAFQPLPAGSDNSENGLLVVNHEFPDASMMFPGHADGKAAQSISYGEVQVEMQAVGVSIIEVRRVHGDWVVQTDSRLNRRITAETEIDITGPAAGHKRMKTPLDPTGRRCRGTLFNCSGGVTPWGTILTAEENFNLFFWGNRSEAERLAPEEASNLDEYGIGVQAPLDQSVSDIPLPGGLWGNIGWYRHDPRFDIGQNPTEPNRFGWIVEVDPYSPKLAPKKRTAMGRFKHESAGVFAKHKKQVVVYSGDDERYQFVYKFISKGNYREGKTQSNMNLLEDGDLYAAQFYADGTGQWIKLALDDDGDVAKETGVNDPAEVLIETRKVARALGATPMDRPEDIEVDSRTERVYLTLTENKKLKPEEANAVNPRALNYWGHIVEIVPLGKDGDRDHWGDVFEWNILLLAGDPRHPDPSARGVYHPQLSESGWFQNPDNLAFDPLGRMWIASDGFPSRKLDEDTPAPVHDGLWACETTGPNRALTKHFFGCPRGAEMCGPCFTPDGKTLFVAVQHPGRETGASYDAPATRWPDFDAKTPPRPSIVAVTKNDGGVIGS